MGWQWHQLDHMQVICTSLQSATHQSSPIFLRTGRSFCHPTNNVEALKAMSMYKRNMWEQLEMTRAFKAATEVVLVAVRPTSSPQLRLIASVFVITSTFLRITQHRECIADGCQHQVQYASRVNDTNWQRNCALLPTTTSLIIVDNFVWWFYCLNDESYADDNKW